MNTPVIIAIAIVLLIIIGAGVYMWMPSQSIAPVIQPSTASTPAVTPAATSNALKNDIVYGELWTGPNYTGTGYQITDPAYRSFESLGIAPGSITSARTKSDAYDINLFTKDGWVTGVVKGVNLTNVGEWKSGLVGVSVAYNK